MIGAQLLIACMMLATVHGMSPAYKSYQQAPQAPQAPQMPPSYSAPAAPAAPKMQTYSAPAAPQVQAYSAPAAPAAAPQMQSYSAPASSAPVDFEALYKSQMESLVDTCIVGKVQPVWQGAEIIETYCRCPSGSYGFDCKEGFFNPCMLSTVTYTPADASLSRKYFIECASDLPYLFKCPGSLVWNQAILSCDWEFTPVAPGSELDPRTPTSYEEFKPEAPMMNTYSAPAAPQMQTYSAPAAPRMPAYKAPAAPRMPSFSAPKMPAFKAPSMARGGY
jgi:hypothetical protein